MELVGRVLAVYTATRTWLALDLGMVQIAASK